MFTGDIDEVREVVGQLGRAGATDLILSPLERRDEHLDEFPKLL